MQKDIHIFYHVTIIILMLDWKMQQFMYIQRKQSLSTFIEAYFHDDTCMDKSGKEVDKYTFVLPAQYHLRNMFLVTLQREFIVL